MLAPIDHKILKRRHRTLTSPILRLQSRLVIAVKMVIDYVKFRSSINDWSWEDFSEGEIEGAYLPFLVACEEVCWVLVTTGVKWNPLLSLPRNCKVWKLFQKVLFPFFYRVFIFALATLFLVVSSNNCRIHIFLSFMIIKCSKGVYFLWSYNFHLHSLCHDLFCFSEFFIFRAFQYFSLEVFNWPTGHNCWFHGAY